MPGSAHPDAGGASPTNDRMGSGERVPELTEDEPFGVEGRLEGRLGGPTYDLGPTPSRNGKHEAPGAPLPGVPSVPGVPSGPLPCLVAIDTLTTFLPGRNEASAPLMMEALLPLRRLSQRGVAILLNHHPKKGLPLPGQAARGSGALASFTDINLEMSWYQPKETTDRRRRILAHSRHEETPRQLVIELNADGDDYLVHGTFDDDEFAQNWEKLCMVLEDANDKKTRQELRDEWPRDFPCPSDATLYRWLVRAVAAGFVCQEGTGRRADPFRHWLPSRAEQWKQDPMHQFNQMMDESQRWVERQFGTG
jgi:hypothetical protein